MKNNAIQDLESEEKKIKAESKSKCDSNRTPQKQGKLILFLSISVLLFFLIIVFLFVYFFLIKKEKIISNAQESTSNQENNHIEASYYAMAGKEMKLINPDDIGLKDEDYSIEEIEFISKESSNLRYLKFLNTNNGKFLPSSTGILTTKIIFKNKLNSLDGLFKNNKELIKVNLGKFNMEEVTSMKSTFSGCSNLTEVNLEGVNSSNLEKMENTFENCTELKIINLSPLNTSKIDDMNNIFSGCEKLEKIDLTSFKKIFNSLFTGIKSKPDIIANELISNEIKNIFKKLFSIDINIIINIFDGKEDYGQCIIGENEKCKTCSKKINSNCLTCNDGYYLPYHEMENKICLSCNIINHCISCLGEKNYIICSSCESGYELKDNKCQKKEISGCIIGENEKCKTCNTNFNLRDECETCNMGYFLPEDAKNKTLCVGCNIDNCLKCAGTRNIKLCAQCYEGFKLRNGICIEELCSLGENEKCASCRTEIGRKKECLTCNEGYFINENEGSIKEKYTCKKCDLDECLQCSEIKNKKVCLKCKEGFELKDGSCFEETCSTGENEKCASCRTEAGRKKECLTCNEGYFIYEDEKNINQTICQKCDLDNCSQCYGTKNNIKVCLQCYEGFELKNGRCIEEKCSIGENEKCASCRTEEGRKRQCLTCNEGYYLKEDNSLTCNKCSILNCKNCYFYVNKEFCQECNDNFEETKNSIGFIEKCFCPEDHKYYHGLCVEKGNWIEIDYNITDISKNNQIIYSTRYCGLNLNDLEMYYNNSIVPLTLISYGVYFNFEKKGLFKFKINIKKTLYSMEWMFTNMRYIKNIKFLPGFDSSKVTTMDTMFACTDIEAIDMGYLDTQNLINLKHFLEYSNKIKTINLSNFNTSKTINMRGMFKNNANLKEIDLTSFDTSKVNDCLIMFHDFPKNCTIIISNKFTKCRNQIPYENKIINIDDISCKNFENCEKCSGSKETLFCIKCSKGYQLLDNKCIVPNCELGDNEKCLSCNNIKGKENECSECNEGYTLANLLNKKNCIKCKIDGCKNCNNSAEICEECKLNYQPIFEANTQKIIKCNLLCELGNNDKCSSCNTKYGYEFQCASCNEGYKLINGKCKKFENSFIAIYNVSSITTFTRIMCVSENNIKLNDFDMYVNDQLVYPYIDQGRWRSWMDEDYIAYKFPKLGKYKVKIEFKKILTDMKYLFVDCYDLISIEFNEAFDTSHVLCMYYMFCSCDSLEKINVSSFNTSLVGDMEGMFTGLDSLTSLNLSNFDTKNTDFMQCMFAYSEQLSFIDISNFDSTYLAGGASIFENIAPSGTIIVNKKFNRLYSLPEGWNIIYKD